MKVTVEELSPVKRALLVELPSERVTDRVEATYRTWGQKLQLPGLRPRYATRCCRRWSRSRFRKP
jgi:FKBP-type peptidyl-prolyl cis-trans isomerase (trigger factor)